MITKSKEEVIKKRINIYQSYTNHYYNNNHYIIGNLFLPVLCVCPAGVCSAGSRSLLKLSQPGSCWQVGRNWQAWKILASLVFTGKLAETGKPGFVDNGNS